MTLDSKKFTKDLATRLLLFAYLPVTLVIMVGALYLIEQYRADLTDHYHKTMSTASSALGAAAKYAIGLNIYDEVERLITDDLQNNENIISLRIYDDDNKLLLERQLRTPKGGKVEQNRTAVSFSSGQTGDGEILGWVELTTENVELYAIRNYIIKNVAGTITLIIAGMLLMAYTIRREVILPVRQVGRRLTAIMEGKTLIETKGQYPKSELADVAAKMEEAAISYRKYSDETRRHLQQAAISAKQANLATFEKLTLMQHVFASTLPEIARGIELLEYMKSQQGNSSMSIPIEMIKASLSSASDQITGLADILTGASDEGDQVSHTMESLIREIRQYTQHVGRKHRLQITVNDLYWSNDKLKNTLVILPTQRLLAIIHFAIQLLARNTASNELMINIAGIADCIQVEVRDRNNLLSKQDLAAINNIFAEVEDSRNSLNENTLESLMIVRGLQVIHGWAHLARTNSNDVFFDLRIPALTHDVTSHEYQEHAKESEPKSVDRYLPEENRHVVMTGNPHRLDVYKQSMDYRTRFRILPTHQMLKLEPDNMAPIVVMLGDDNSETDEIAIRATFPSTELITILPAKSNRSGDEFMLYEPVDIMQIVQMANQICRAKELVSTLFQP